jgi:glucose-1-phosphate cytidylyltransferase
MGRVNPVAELASVPVVILCGGLGSRLREETEVRPKPMVEIGGQPILWHIMNIYAAWGATDFKLALGYKAEVIKEYFLNFHPHTSDMTVHLASGRVDYHSNKSPDWLVTLVDTGLHTETGGRVKRLRPWIMNRTFMLTYGDGVGDVDISALLRFHRSHGKLATVTAVRPPARFGNLVLEKDQVQRFEEKSQAEAGWINGGFFVLEPGVFDYIASDSVPWEMDPLQNLAKDGQLMSFRHQGFWAPMDTLREKHRLQEMWDSGKAPWKLWCY